MRSTNRSDHSDSTTTPADRRRGQDDRAQRGMAAVRAAAIEALEARRLLSAGDLDVSYSGDGKATFPFAARFGGPTQALDVAAQSDGKFVVVGSTDPRNNGDSDMLIARYTADGQVDPTFGIDGAVVVDYFGGRDVAHGVAIDGGGRIFVAGVARKTDGNDDAALVRLTTGGQLDTAFSNDGRASYRYETRDDVAYDLALAPGGKVVLGGESDGDYFVARVSAATGARDTAFSGDGLHVVDFGGTDVARGVAVQSDGKVVLGGSTSSGTGNFAVARLTAGGALDPTFHDDGRRPVDFFGRADTGFDVLIDPSGRIVVGGYVVGETFRHLGAARLTPDGMLDASFSGDGRTSVPERFSGVIDTVSEGGLVLAADGTLVVTGGQVARFGADGAMLDYAQGLEFLASRAGVPMPGHPNAVVFVARDFDLRAVASPEFRGLEEFGYGGRAHGGFEFGERADDVAIDAAGRGVLAGTPRGSLRVWRVNPDGSPDTSFGGGDGRAEIPFLLNPDDTKWRRVSNAQVEVLPGGDVLVLARAWEYDEFASGLLLARYNPDGSPDTSFGGGDGYVVHDVGDDFDTFRFAIAPDGKIVVPRVHDQIWFLMDRFNADGSPDDTFSITAVPMGRYTGLAGLVVTPDGKVTVGVNGEVEFSDGYDGVGTHLWRFTSTGAADTSFSGNGHLASGDLWPGMVLTDLGVLSDGRIVGTMRPWEGPHADVPLPPDDFRVVRLTSTGDADATFGIGGQAWLDLGGQDDARTIAVQSDGKLVVGGSTTSGTGGGDAALVRFNINGTVDTGFGTNGVVRTDFAGGADGFSDVRRTSDGKLWATGTAGTNRFAAARYLLEEGTTTPPDDGPVRVENRTLIADGAAGADALDLNYESDGIEVVRNGTTYRFAYAEVDAVRVNGLGGDDTIEFADTAQLDGIDVPPATLDGGDGDDEFRQNEFGNRDAFHLVGGAGNDDAIALLSGTLFTFDGGAGIDFVTGENSKLNLGNGNFPNVENAELNDGILIGNELDNHLELEEAGGEIYGLGGNDTLESAMGGQPSLLDGGVGNDALFGEDGPDTLLGGDGDDTLLGSIADDLLDGGAGHDSLAGEHGRDTLRGGDGNDTIQAADGHVDTLDGGAGTDSASVDDPDSVTNVENVSGQGAGTIYLSNGTLFVDGTAGDDSLSLFYNDDALRVEVRGEGAQFTYEEVDAVVLRGFGGNDFVGFADNSGGDAVPPATLDGGEGDDRFRQIETGNRDAFHLVGGAGNDRAEAPEGLTEFTFDGGAGTDFVTGDNFKLNLGNGNFPNVEDATLIDGTIIGNALNNRLLVELAGELYGMGGNDTLEGGDAGNSLLDGGDGHDLLVVAPGGAGGNTLRGGAGNDELRARNANADTLDGGSGTDTAVRDTTDTATGIENDSATEPEPTGPVYLVGRTLHVDGTAGRDTFQLVYIEPEAGDEAIRVTVNGESFHFAYVVADAVVVRGFAGEDRIEFVDFCFGQTPPTTLDGGDGNDHFVQTDHGNRDAFHLFGRAGDDRASAFLEGTEFTFDGGAGTDLVEGENVKLNLGNGNFPNVEDAFLFNGGTLIGNALPNRLRVDTAGEIYGMDGNDTLTGGSAGITLIDGGDGNDLLTIAPFAEGGNTLLGGAGDDELRARNRVTDTLDGGTGADRADRDDVDMATGIEAATPPPAVFSANTLVVTGTNADDSIALSETAERVTVHFSAVNYTFDPAEFDNVVVHANAGRDVLSSLLSGLASNGPEQWSVTLHGGAGNDQFFHHEDYDPVAFFGNDGDDGLSWDGLGASGFDGGAGRDGISVGGVGDHLDLNDFTSVEDGHLIDGVLIGTDGDNDLSLGGDGTILGGGGDDHLDGSDGDNVLRGEAGNDTIHGLGGADALFGGTGHDSLDGGAGDDYYEGDDGNDVLVAVNGGPGADTLNGDDGDDELYADDGDPDDTLNGGGGTDTARRDDGDAATGIETFA